jgi:hypothetical protein
LLLERQNEAAAREEATKQEPREEEKEEMSTVIYTLKVYFDDKLIEPKKLYFFDRTFRDARIDDFKGCACTIVLSSIVTEDECFPLVPGEAIGDGS